jgi:drug/metabolite transporter (DMT)-like permease
VSWFPIAILAAFSTATGDTILKARFSHLSPVEMAAVKFTSPLPFLLPLLLAMPWPKTDAVFWRTVIALVPLEIAALVLYMQALKVSPLSLSIPFLAFTPVFIILTGWWVLDETVSGIGLLGIMFTASGAYVLHFKAGGKGFFAPLKAMARERGSRLMLAVAGIYSLTSVLGKQAIQHSEPFFFGCFYFVLLGTISPFVLYGLSKSLSRKKRRNVVENTGACPSRLSGNGPWLSQWKVWLAVGFVQTTLILSHMWAIHLIAAAYMIAVKRLSLVFSVVYGRLVFKEEDTVQRLAGAGLMVFGVALIALAG